MDVVSPIITPFRNGKLDIDTFALHAKNLLRKGVDALFVAGSTGLGPALGLEEKKALLEAAASLTKRVILHVSSLNFEDVLALLKYADKFDIEAVAPLPPYYYPGIPEKHVVKYFRDLCGATAHPLYLYNYPAAAGRDVNAKLAKEVGCLRGVKDTGEDLGHTVQYKRLMPWMKVYKGSDALIFASYASGLDGVVVSSTNYLPEAVSRIRDYVKEGRLEEARKLQNVILELLDVGRSVGYQSAVYEYVKIFQGYDAGEPRPPIYPLDAEEKAKLAEAAEKVKELIK
ncbi:MAG: bifunctional 2-dehydro-3-deoxy-phosphogluconate/2-dehydro-3-deoxy-6-phosphogalactonate aldolase [Pyrobaculum sp.]